LSSLEIRILSSEYQRIYVWVFKNCKLIVHSKTLITSLKILIYKKNLWGSLDSLLTSKFYNESISSNINHNRVK